MKHKNKNYILIVIAKWGFRGVSFSRGGFAWVEEKKRFSLWGKHAARP